METEGLYKKEVDVEVGDRRGDTNEQHESYADAGLDEATEALMKKGCYAAVDTINRLDANKTATKAELFNALNINGLSWKSLDTYIPDKAAGDALNAAIVEWAGEVELTHGDTKAVFNANKALADKIEAI